MGNNVSLPDLIDSLLKSAKSQNLFGDFEETLTREDSRSLIKNISAAINKFADGENQIGVAILLPRDRYYLASIFAVWQSGNYFIPLSLDWPKEHLELILRIASPDLIICSENELLPGYPCLPISKIMSSQRHDIFEAQGEQFTAGPSSESIAYVIFTSGSTGEPKGVEISHGAYLSYINWVREYFADFSTNRALLISAELTFDITLGDIAFALAFGSEIHVSPDPRNVFFHAKLVRDRNIDTFYSVPSTISRLFGLAEGREDVDLSALKLLLSGGDSFSPALIESVKRASPNAAFYNVYGPTEVTINCFATRVDDKLDLIRDKEMVPIGLPFKHLNALLLDPESLTCADNSQGELVIAGSQCMTRYLGDKNRTDQAFVDIRNTKYYRTGDLVEIGKDGLFYVLGRIDKLVKIKGYRISLATIDNLLQDDPRVSEVRTVSTLSKEGDAELIALFVPRLTEDDELNQSLLSLCRSKLPWYAVPRKIIAVDSLPLGLSGKYDIKSLEIIAKDLLEKGGVDNV